MNVKVFLKVYIVLYIILNFCGVLFGKEKGRNILLAIVNGEKIYEEDYEKWLYNYNIDKNTILENYIESLLFEKKAGELGITVSEKDIEEILKRKKIEPPLGKYNKKINWEKYRLMKREIKSDLMASRIIYKTEGISETTILERFYKEYGYLGQMYQLEHITILWEQLALDKIEGIYKMIKEGGIKKFRQLAREESDDKDTASSGGYFGRASVFGRKYGLDAVIKKLKVKEFSEPVRSEEGYHIIYVNNIKDGEKYVSHILIKVITPALYKTELYKKKRKEMIKVINKIFKEVKNGVSFRRLSKKYSRLKINYFLNYKEADDWINRYVGRDFGAQLISMKKGEIKILESPKGFHIVKILNIITTEYSDELRKKIKKEIYTTGILNSKRIIQLGLKLMKEYKVYYLLKPLDEKFF